MINGYEVLKEKYPDFDEEQRTPNGIDLRLGKVYTLDNQKEQYGLYKDEKVIPEYNEITPIKDDKGRLVWEFLSYKPYILEIDKPIKIDSDCAQLYTSRSTLLRCGTSLHTAVGDAGFYGKLSFLFVNFNIPLFVMEKGVRFAQLIDHPLYGATIVYDGDYQEEGDDVNV